MGAIELEDVRGRRWRTMPEDVQFQMDPVTRPIIEAAVRAAKEGMKKLAGASEALEEWGFSQDDYPVVGHTSEAVLELSQYLIAVELATRVVKGWRHQLRSPETGELIDQYEAAFTRNGEVVEPTRAGFLKIMKDDRFCTMFQAVSFGDRYLVAAEGKGSASAPNGTSAEAESTAESATSISGPASAAPVSPADVNAS